MLEYDFAVIGGGSAGYAAASLAAKQGFRVVVVEGGEKVGGLCILRGCMPSKTLLATSVRAREMWCAIARNVVTPSTIQRARGTNRIAAGGYTDFCFESGEQRGDAFDRL